MALNSGNSREIIKDYLDLTSERPINFFEVRNVCFYGISDVDRPILWKILLKYLPKDKKKWEARLKEQRECYYQLTHDLISLPNSPVGEEDGYWNILEQIDRDVLRTLPDISFFQQPIGKSNLYTEYSLRGHRLFKFRQEPEDNVEEKHWHAFERILFLYSKLNTFIGYVQGMNELLAPIYFVFANSNDFDDQQYAEADTFFCFSNLMAEIRDFFIPSMDLDSHSGVHASLQSVMNLLERTDLELFQNMQEKKLDPVFYCFRWTTVLYTQEFRLPEVMRIWDTLLSDCNRFEFMKYFSCSMLINIRERLLGGNFDENLNLLQNYPKEIEIDTLLHIAYILRQEDYSKSKATRFTWGRNFFTERNK